MTKSKRSAGDRPLDEIDHKILRVLEAEGRLPFSAVAKKVHLSESATFDRVRRLEAAGAITGYGARIDPQALDRNVSAVVLIRLSGRDAAAVDEFLAAMNAFPSLISCFQVAGPCDFVARFAAKDVPTLERILTDELRQLRAIERTESMLVLKSIKHP